MENDFNFVNLSKNDNFSSLNGSDIQELIYELNYFLLSMRETIGVTSEVTFGTEIEFENIKNGRTFADFREDFIKKNRRLYKKSDWWDVDSDTSLTYGAEVQSPIMIDNKKHWKDLEKVCEFISEYGNIGKNAAAHVHMGAHILDKEKQYWLNFLKLWSVYENVIYRFAYGEYLTKLPGISYCNPYADEFIKDYYFLKEQKCSFKELIDRISHERAQAVNFRNVKSYSNSLEFGNTIEFRCPNGTIDPVIWQNNINLFANLLLYSKSASYNDDIIDRRITKLPIDIKRLQSNATMYTYYTQIYLEQALELVDLIFKRNIDKVYFLKQYLKSFRISDEPMIASPTLTKKAPKK